MPTKRTSTNRTAPAPVLVERERDTEAFLTDEDAEVELNGALDEDGQFVFEGDPPRVVQLSKVDPRLKGLWVSFDGNTTLEAVDELFEIQEYAAKTKGKAAKDPMTNLRVASRIRAFLSSVLLEWNLSLRKGAEVVPLPQPTEGGLAKCPLELLAPMMRAFNLARTDPNSGAA